MMEQDGEGENGEDIMKEQIEKQVERNVEERIRKEIEKYIGMGNLKN